jgi:hypothetical protein
VYKYTFNHYPIIPIHLLYEKVTHYSRYFDRHRISFNWLIVVRSAEFLKRTLTKRFADAFLLRQLEDISNEAGGHLKIRIPSCLYLTLAVWHFCGQGDPLIDCNFQLCRSPTAMFAENMPCLVRISTVAMSAKMPHLKYASSHPRSPYATKRGYASIATQPKSFPLSVNSRRPTNHCAKSQSAPMPRQTLGSRALIHQSARGQSSLPSRKLPALIP